MSALRLSALLRLLSLMALLGLLTPAVAATQAPKVETIAVVTPASRTNLGWDQQATDGIEAAAEELGIEALVQENGGYDDITPILNDLKDDGAGLIVCHASTGYPTNCADFAVTENVPVVVIEDPQAVVPNLVSDLETQAQEPAYLAGVLAAQTTKTGIVGVVVSGEPPTWNFMTVGFAEGVKATNGSAKLLYNVIGEGAYDDSAGAKRVTEIQLAAGADVIFGMGDGASFGMIEAVREHNDANPDAGARFIDVIGDKRTDYADVLLTSVVFDFQATYVQMVKDLEAGTFGKVYTLDVQNKGVRLLDLPDDVPQAVKDKVAAVEKDIVAGKVTVSEIGDAEGMRDKLKELGYL